MDRLMGMQVFVSVVETGSFTAASERLGMSRAAASKYVSQLESHLGGRLLHRTTRRVNPTESGRNYFERCKEILQHLEERTQFELGVLLYVKPPHHISANFFNCFIKPDYISC